jgi:hypothetical protein
MFEHFTSVACEFSQPLLFTPQKSAFMEVILIIFHCVFKPSSFELWKKNWIEKKLENIPKTSRS